MSQLTLIQKLEQVDKELRPAIIAIPDSAARDVIRQLARGAVWDGNLCSKSGRDVLVSLRYADRWNGINFLTQTGFAVVDSLWKLSDFVKE